MRKPIIGVTPSVDEDDPVAPLEDLGYLARQTHQVVMTAYGVTAELEHVQVLHDLTLMWRTPR